MKDEEVKKTINEAILDFYKERFTFQEKTEVLDDGSYSDNKIFTLILKTSGNPIIVPWLVPKKNYKKKDFQKNQKEYIKHATQELLKAVEPQKDTKTPKTSK